MNQDTFSSLHTGTAKEGKVRHVTLKVMKLGVCHSSSGNSTLRAANTSPNRKLILLYSPKYSPSFTGSKEGSSGPQTKENMKVVCSFNKRLMGPYYVPGTVLDAGSTSGRLQNLEVREAKQLDLENWSLSFLPRESVSKQAYDGPVLIL